MIKSLSSRITALLLLIALIALTGCVNKAVLNDDSANEVNTNANDPAKAVQSIVLATTTSTDHTGLLDAIIPDFTEKTGIEVKVVAVGTGQALEMGKTGEADVLLVHAKASEVAFVEDGYGIERFDVMYNDFVLLGAEPLPEVYKQDINGAFQYLYDESKRFVSRGDDSGTHKKELAVWKNLGLDPQGSWYISAGKGMGEVLQMANEMQAYALSDRGTYLSMKENLDLEVVVEKSSELLNQYGVIAVNTEKNPAVHLAEAQQFVDWILSKETQEKIRTFGVDQFGQPLFVPNAKE
ncbi:MULTISPECIES: extracellular solute-binding protein [unclassified Fusibacter]|uniref:extracellular solute-binding protein n=1 Tax=unclassified Fusibacter TaxID=2624464 RepID=UPI001011AD1F|nr:MULTISPECIES: extracellular solute-binding protein [unclassified Fusibacter]MCK8061134.1 extracellular solute-binding protein [Fusibacter sp. A2]NPE23330.1 extracellular solute-binding protein [Fusibacter sp. A1]RXV59373.1 extracellular solute-binding protein [Fusibacter sp. A1]